MARPEATGALSWAAAAACEESTCRYSWACAAQARARRRLRRRRRRRPWRSRSARGGTARSSPAAAAAASAVLFPPVRGRRSVRLPTAMLLLLLLLPLLPLVLLATLLMLLFALQLTSLCGEVEAAARARAPCRALPCRLLALANGRCSYGERPLSLPLPPPPACW